MTRGVRSVVGDDVGWPVVWQARWIWGRAPEGDLGALLRNASPTPDSFNRWYYLRRPFALTEVPATVPCRVTADSRYVLYVNGNEVARGPARSAPDRLTWASVDLAPYLTTGTNVISALARFYGSAMAWWRPTRPSFQLGYGGFLLEAPAVDVHSDATWVTLAAPYRQRVRGAASSAVTEVVDGGGLPHGWSEPGFDDSGWSAAEELHAEWLTDNPKRVPCNPYPSMEHDGIGLLTAEAQTLELVETRAVAAVVADDPAAAWSSAGEWDPAVDPNGPTVDRGSAQRGSTTTGTDTRLTWDAGRITLATPWVEVQGTAGAIVDLYAGEDIDGDGRVVTRPREYALRYELAGSGTPERIEAYEAVGFRYLTAVVRGPAEVSAVGATERRYPRVGAASFRCSDERLNRIWEVGARTLEVCSTDAFLDCPGREQRAWVGDAYIHGLLTYITNEDWRLARRSIILGAQSQRPDGLLAMSAAGDLSTVALTIPDYSLHWIRALARFHEYSGDARLARRLVPAALQIADAFEHWRDHDGLLHGVPGWVFVDWAQTQRSDVVGALNALHAVALEDLADLLEILDEGAERIRDLRQRADRTREGFDLLWDGDRGVYVDAADGSGRLSRVSQQTNTAAILGHCAPRERWAGMLAHVLDPKRLVITDTPADVPEPRLAVQWMDPGLDETHDVVMAQPFFSHIVHQAVVQAGRPELLPDLCRRWWAQIERGNTTFEEYWDAAPGEASRAHAWAGTPTYDLTTHILGVAPLAPGFARARIAPRFGDLASIVGRVPTPHGTIAVELTPTGGTIEVPVGVEAEVSFPDGDVAACTLGPGQHRIGEAV